MRMGRLLGRLERSDLLLECFDLLLLFLDRVDEDGDEIGVGNAECFFFILSDINDFGNNLLDLLGDEADFGRSFRIAFPMVACRAKLEDFVESVSEVFDVGFEASI